MTAQADPPAAPGDPATAPGDPGYRDDAALIRLSQAEPEHFATLFRRHAPTIQRYVARRLGPDVAEDIVAEVFLAAFRQRAAYLPSQPDARPWLYGIATHLIGRHRRSEIRAYRALARTGTDPVTEPFTDRVDAAVSAEGMTRQLAGALARLPSAHRDALLLVAWGGLSYEQAAASLGVPVGTVRSRLSRARARLRLALAEPGSQAALGKTGPPPPRGAPDPGPHAARDEPGPPAARDGPRATVRHSPSPVRTNPRRAS
jgi:RNA polymerase sigma factor (sigma-70 family)